MSTRRGLVFLAAITLLAACGGSNEGAEVEDSIGAVEGSILLLSDDINSDNAKLTSSQFTTGQNHSFSSDKSTPTSYSAIKTRYLPYPSQGVMLGQGWDSFSSKPIGNNCIVFSRQFVPGHDLNITTEEIKSRYQLNESMKMSMSGSYSGFGAKASAKGSYSKSLDIDQNNTNILANVNIWKGDEFAAPSLIVHEPEYFPKPGESQYFPISLTKDASDILAEKIPDKELKVLSDKEKENAINEFKSTQIKKFRKLCGDSYVGHIRNGASLSAYLTFESLSREEKQSMAASISASGWGAKLSGSYSSDKKVALDNSSSGISIFQTGGFLNATPMNIADFNKTVSSFTQSSDPNYFPVKPYEIGLMSYANLPNWPTSVPIENPDSMLEVITLYWLFDDLRKDYLKALQYPSQYSIIDLNNLSGDLKFSMVEQDCEYSAKVASVKIVRDFTQFLKTGARYRKEITRSKKEWVPSKTNVDECPKNEEFSSFMTSDVSTIRKNLAHVNVIQVALREAIENCRSYSDTTNCNSRSIFEKMTNVITEGYTEETAKSNSEPLEAFKLSANIDKPAEISAKSDLEIAYFEDEEKIDLEELYGLYFYLTSEEDDTLGASLLTNVKNKSDAIVVFKEAVNKLNLEEDTPVALNTFLDDDKIPSISSLELGPNPLTAKEYVDFIASKTKNLENQRVKLEALKSFNSVEVLKATIIKAELDEAEFPNTWPFNLVGTEAKQAQKKNSEEHWNDIVGSYYYFVAALPVRVKSSSNVTLTTYKEIKNGKATETDLVGNTRAQTMRKVKIDTLLGISESFCDTDIIHSLCRTLEDIVSDINTVGIVSFNDVTAIPGKIHNHKRCWRHGLFKTSKTCFYWKTQDPTEYLTQIITGKDIRL